MSLTVVFATLAKVINGISFCFLYVCGEAGKAAES
jgi:hypothetical protein